MVNPIEELLKSVNAWQTGHFLLSSGLHSDQYMQCQKILQYPLHGMTLAKALSEKIGAGNHQIQAVVGPALGAVHMEVFMALALNQQAGITSSATDKQIRAIFAERDAQTNEFAIRRGVEITPGERILVVEDVTTTGGSARKVIELLRELGAAPVAVAAIIDRSGGKATFDLPFYNLFSLELNTYEAAACPMCKAGTSAIKPGSNRK
ncbi:MAG: orotate phosphoribosyltransferase [Candidatus Obscuribacter sp.]|nr:orotate phosphoribosyltransferase [Candidatus Obscuribacter sp.]MBL0188750.1 orotate phosphoribosyltransferase [Candidatus Obscuribacter sp.]